MSVEKLKYLCKLILIGSDDASKTGITLCFTIMLEETSTVTKNFFTKKLSKKP